jgi:hypothetical protein
MLWTEQLSWQGQEIFLYSKASRLALWPTQPPNQWVPRALSLSVKWQGHLNLTTLFHLMLKSKMVELHCFHNMVRS